MKMVLRVQPQERANALRTKLPPCQPWKSIWYPKVGGEVKSVNVIIKADVQGSVEARLLPYKRLEVGAEGNHRPLSSYAINESGRNLLKSTPLSVSLTPTHKLVSKRSLIVEIKSPQHHLQGYRKKWKTPCEGNAGPWIPRKLSVKPLSETRFKVGYHRRIYGCQRQHRDSSVRDSWRCRDLMTAPAKAWSNFKDYRQRSYERSKVVSWLKAIMIFK